MSLMCMFVPLHYIQIVSSAHCPLRFETQLLLCFRHLSRSLGALDAMFMSDRQQDATEFLVHLLDLFREQFSSSKLDLSPEGWYFATLQPHRCVYLSSFHS